MISATWKARKAEMKPTNSFLSEIRALRKVFEEPDDPQRTMIKAGQIAWSGDYEMLLMLYAEVLKSYARTAPGAKLGPLYAHEMIRIIMLRNHELGSALHELVMKKTIELDDRQILKEAQSWMERKATSNLGSQRQTMSSSSGYR